MDSCLLVSLIVLQLRSIKNKKTILYCMPQCASSLLKSFVVFRVSVSVSVSSFDSASLAFSMTTLCTCVCECASVSMCVCLCVCVYLCFMPMILAWPQMF